MFLSPVVADSRHTVVKDLRYQKVRVRVNIYSQTFPSLVYTQKSRQDHSKTFCSNCGNERPEQGNFCINCGYKRLRCGSCAHEHESTVGNFCINCGQERPGASLLPTAANTVVVTATTTVAPTSTVATTLNTETDTLSAETANTTTVVTATTTTDTLSAETATAAAPKKRYFKSGWSWCCENNIFIAPDGVIFGTRQEASKYYNKNVAKLEAKRKDGWRVYVDKTNTHCDWIAPDGEVFHSWRQAKAYSVKSDQAIYGKDGLTIPLTSFFGKKKTIMNSRSGTQNNPIDCINDTPNKSKTDKPVQTPQMPTTDKPAPTPQHSQQSRTPKPGASPRKKREFKIPQQSEDGAGLQKLCAQAGTLRNVVKKTQAEVVAKQYREMYTLRRRVSHNMILRVCALV